MFTFGDIIQLTKDYGLETMGVMLICGMIYLFAKGHIDLYIFKKKRTIIQSNSTGHEDVKEVVSEILSSEFFRNLKFKISVDIPAESFSTDHALDALYKDLLIVLYTSYQDVLKDKVRDMDLNDKKDEWVNSFLGAIYHTMETFEKEAKRVGIPQEAVVEFISWFSPFLQQIYNYINVIDSNRTTSVSQKTKFFLLTLELILINATAQIQKFEVFGDKLDGLEYRGLTVGRHKNAE